MTGLRPRAASSLQPISGKKEKNEFYNNGKVKSERQAEASRQTTREDVNYYLKLLLKGDVTL